MPRLSIEDRGRAIGLLQGHNAVAAVARILGCAKSTIARLWTKYRQTGKLISQMPTQIQMQYFRAICPIFPRIFLEMPLLQYRRRTVFELLFQTFQVM